MPRDELDEREGEDEVELPPLDADEDDVAREGEADELDAIDEEGGLDDAAADDLEVGGLIDDPVDDEATEAAGEGAEGLEVGSVDLLGDEAESAVGDDAEGTLADEGDDDLSSFEGEAADGGVEGPDEPIENEVDEDRLPASDADDGADLEDAEGPLVLPDEDAPLPPWGGERWAPLEGAGCEVPCVGVAVDGGRVIAVTDPAGTTSRGPGSILVVAEGDLVPRNLDAPAGTVALAACGGRVAVATSRGAVTLLPIGAGTTQTLRPASPHPISTRLAAAPGRLWIAANGVLASVELGDGPPVVTDVRSPPPGEVLCIGASGAALVALVGVAQGLSVACRRGDDQDWTVTALGVDDVATADLSAPAILATASGAGLAAVGARGLFVSRDAGATFRLVRLPCVIAACYLGEGDQPDLAVLVARATDGAAHVVRVPAVGPPALLARLSVPALDEGSDEPFAEAQLAWDGVREVLWVAAPSGLWAVGRARHH